MPETVVAAFAAYGVTISTATATLIIQVAVVVSSALYNQSRARAAARAAKNAYNAGLQDRQLVIRSAIAPRNIVFGRDRVSGPLVFGHQSGTKGEFLHLVVMLAAHECDAVESIYFNEVELAVPDVNGFIQTGPYSRNPVRTLAEHTTAGSIVLAHTPSRIVSVTQNLTDPDLASQIFSPASWSLSGSTVTFVAGAGNYTVNYEWVEPLPVVRIKTHLGGAGQVADPDLIAECGGKWTAQHVGVGITYLYIRLEYDVDIFGQIGLPNISARIRGAKLYDPRTTTTTWSDNAALCTRYYLRSTELGVGNTAAEVPDAEIIVAANISDEFVAFTNLARAGFVTHWNTAGNAESWTVANATAVVAGGLYTLTATASDPVMRRGSLSFLGTVNRSIRARIKRTAGTGWDGVAYYTTSGHGESGSFCKVIAQPVYDANGWATAVWDMSALTAGGTDWTSSTITGIRLDLGTTSGDAFAVDWVAVGAEDTQRRYTTNGSISTADGQRSNIETLLLPMAGNAVWVQGRWLVRAGAHRSSEFTLNESWVVRVSQLAARRPRTELFNAATGSFIDPAQNYAEVQIPTVTNALYEAKDGGKRIVRSIPMPLNNDSTRGQRLLKIALERARQAEAIVIVCNMRAYDTLPTQVGTVNLARYGFVSKLMEVRRRVYNPVERTVTLTLVETAAAVWDWNFGEATLVDLAANTALPNAFTAPAALTGMAVASGTNHLVKLGDGSIITRGYVTWTQSSDIFVVRGGQIELEWKLDNAADWQRGAPVGGDSISAYIDPLSDLRLTMVRIRPVNASGRAGPWTYTTHTVVGKSALPVNVSGFTYSKQPGFVCLSWVKSTELDYKETEVRYGASWAAGTVVFRGPADHYDWSWPPAGVYSMRAKHVDTSGNYSLTEDTFTLTLTPEEIAVYNFAFRPNILPNGGFEYGKLNWSVNMPSGPDTFVVADSGWGRHIYSVSMPNGIGTVNSDEFPVYAGVTYTIHGDSAIFGAAGSFTYFDLLFYDASHTFLSDGGQNLINAPHDFSVLEANRAIHAVSAVAPAGAAYARARCVWNGVTVTVVAFRLVKVEQGGLPYTPYSQFSKIVPGGVGTGEMAGGAATGVIQSNPATVYDVSTAGTTNPLGPITVTLDGLETAIIVSCEVTYYYQTSTSGSRSIESEIAVMVDGTGYGVRSINIDTPVTTSVTSVYVPFNVGYVVSGLGAGSHTFGLDFRLISSAGWGHSDAIQEIKTRVEIIKR